MDSGTFKHGLHLSDCRRSNLAVSSRIHKDRASHGISASFAMSALDLAVLGSPNVLRHIDRVTFSHPKDSSSGWTA
jgi:hypothetical protein